ncbi:MAG: hypothetical protein K2J93_07700 [Anaeroplasmataceae bacterium]|nr:hypothetical protein [Anaeroplasmataceae bacterium]
MAKNFFEEFKEFIGNYIYEIIGSPFDTSYLTNEQIEKAKSTFDIEARNNQEYALIFYIPNNEMAIKGKIKSPITEDVLSLIKTICSFFPKVSKYKYSGTGYNRPEISLINQIDQYKYAVQRGICNWVCGSDNGEKIEELLSILEDWAKKTYEGRKVSYSLIIDVENDEEDKDFFFEFLKDEFSATLTDSITSAFIINKKGKLLKYQSVIDEKNHNRVTSYRLDKNVPFRFANLIYKEVKDKKIGLFLLNNGDILISKNQEILLVKRNGKWLNCQLSSFVNAVKDFTLENNISTKLINEIYYTMLDISFSHTGGLIAILKNDCFLNGSEQIVSKFDQLKEDISEENLINIIKEENKQLTENEIKREAKKRVLKKKAILTLLANKNFFIKIERKLRSELAALDGACLIDKEGKLIAIGTIIQNDKGSSGGGRGAAAKKLSQNGLAIKISTDGYIEVFQEGKRIYLIK